MNDEKKFRMYQWGVLVILLVWVVLTVVFAHVAFAATYYVTQSNYSSLSQSHATFSQQFGYQGYDPITFASGTDMVVHIKAQADGTAIAGGQIYLDFCTGDDSSMGNCTHAWNNTTYPHMSSTNVTAQFVASNTLIDVTYDFGVRNDYYTYSGFTFETSVGSLKIYGDSISDDSWAHLQSNSSDLYSEGTRQAYFEAGTGVTGYPTTFYIADPPGSSTSTPITWTSDFDNWNVAFSGGGILYHPNEQQYIKVEYHLLGSTSTLYEDVWQLGSQNFVDGTVTITKNHALTDSSNLSATSTWVAYPVFQEIDDSGDVVTNHVGTVDTFVIDPVNGTVPSTMNVSKANYHNVAGGSLVASTTALLDACSVGNFFGFPYFNNIGACVVNIAQVAGYTLFVPDLSNGSFINNYFQQTIAKPPFNIIFNVVQTVSSSISTATGHDSFTIKVKDMNYNTINLATLDSSTLIRAMTVPGKCDSSCAQDVHDRIFLALRSIIWVSAGLKMVSLITL